MRRFFLLIAGSALVVSAAIPPTQAGARASGPDVDASSGVGQAVGLPLRLPPNVAAIEGRVAFAPGAADLIGVAAGGDATALRPLPSPGGTAFGVYGLSPADGELNLVVVPNVAGVIELKLVIDAAADAAGDRTILGRRTFTYVVAAGEATGYIEAPRIHPRGEPPQAVRELRSLTEDRRIDVDDLHAFRAGWYAIHGTGGDPCRAARQSGDANGDGCVDAVDGQALSAVPSVSSDFEGAHIAGATTFTFTVDSTDDTPDADPGDDVCADADGDCTLRAAMMESNNNAGHDHIEFALPGTAPVTINLTGTLPRVGSASGSVEIDGYTQPGSKTNDDAFGTDAVPGVELRGEGLDTGYAFYVPTAGNTIRGFVIADVLRGIFLDGDDAVDNRILGNIIGIRANNTLPPRGREGISINNGPSDNVIGTPNLADRNVIGNFNKGVFSFGAGTSRNLIKNNLMCIRPNGQRAVCQTAMDHDFGPKDNVIGGSGANERNVIGPTHANAIEFSHGWNPDTEESKTRWQVNGHKVIGNWVGFRADGSFDPDFRSAEQEPNEDNGQAINIYDGANDNVIRGNTISSVHHGISVSMGNTTDNVIRNNVIGVSPQGEHAPMEGWGITFRTTVSHQVVSNVIRNAEQGGIGLLNDRVRRVRISKNIITRTPGPAIRLTPGSNGGANLMVSPPSIRSAGRERASGRGIPGSRVEIFRASRPPGKRGLPTVYLGSAKVNSEGRWKVEFSTRIGSSARISGTQIRPSGNTSRLSRNKAIADI